MDTAVVSETCPDDAALNGLAQKQASLRGEVLPVELQGPRVHANENWISVSKVSSKESTAVWKLFQRQDLGLHRPQIYGMRSSGVKQEHPSFFKPP